MLHERPVFIERGNARLEGLYTAADGTMGAVVSHPHPLMGGDMRNPVVEVITETLYAGGISTLRFNFRGVEMGDGVFDEGRGEQEDVSAAVTYLEGQGNREILLAGYSFGAWVNTGVMLGRSLLPAVLVSPPIKMFPFAFGVLREKIGLIICGDRDPYCPVDEVRNAAAQASCRLEIVPDTDHFLYGRETKLAALIEVFAIGLRSEKK